MDTIETHPFITWLDRELAHRRWSDNQLARRANISHSVISKARSGTLPKWEACEAIAAALQMPVVLVFRKAGLVPPLPDDHLNLEEWEYLLSHLSPRDRDELYQIARIKIEHNGQGE